MNLDELEPGSDTNRLVAEALGAEVEFVPMLRFAPSTDLNDAFWAAERAELFKFHVLMQTWIDKIWVICEAVFDGNDPSAIGLFEENLLVTADTPAMAICLAILKLKETT